MRLDQETRGKQTQARCGGSSPKGCGSGRRTRARTARAELIWRASAVEGSQRSSHDQAGVRDYAISPCPDYQNSSAPRSAFRMHLSWGKCDAGATGLDGPGGLAARRPPSHPLNARPANLRSWPPSSTTDCCIARYGTPLPRKVSRWVGTPSVDDCERVHRNKPA